MKVGCSGYDRENSSRFLILRNLRDAKIFSVIIAVDGSCSSLIIRSSDGAKIGISSKRAKFSIGKYKMVCRVPEMLTEVYDPVVIYRYSFAFKKLLHQTRGSEMVFSGEQSCAVHHPMCRDRDLGGVGCIHSPSYHSGCFTG